MILRILLGWFTLSLVVADILGHVFKALDPEHCDDCPHDTLVSEQRSFGNLRMPAWATAQRGLSEVTF